MIKMKKISVILLVLILLWGCKTKEYYISVLHPRKEYKIVPSKEDNEILAELVKKYNSDKIIPYPYGVTGGVPIFIVDAVGKKTYRNSCGMVSINEKTYIYVDNQEGIDDTDILVDMVDKYKPLLVSINYYSGSFAEVTDNATGKKVRINENDWTDYAEGNVKILSHLSHMVKDCGIYEEDKGIESPIQEEYLYTVNLNNTKRDYYFYISENYLYFEDKVYVLKADLMAYVIKIIENDGYIGDGRIGVNPYNSRDPK